MEFKFQSDYTKTDWTAGWNKDGRWVGVDTGDASDPHKCEVATVNLDNIQLEPDAACLARAKGDARLISGATAMLPIIEILANQNCDHAQVNLIPWIWEARKVIQKMNAPEVVEGIGPEFVHCVDEDDHRVDEDDDADCSM